LWDERSFDVRSFDERSWFGLQSGGGGFSRSKPGVAIEDEFGKFHFFDTQEQANAWRAEQLQTQPARPSRRQRKRERQQVSEGLAFVAPPRIEIAPGGDEIFFEGMAKEIGRLSALTRPGSDNDNDNDDEDLLMVLMLVE